VRQKAKYRVKRPQDYSFFGLQVQSADFLPQPEQTPFSIGLPHFLHGVQPHTWHIFPPFH
jgi:hypothetical protein